MFPKLDAKTGLTVALVLAMPSLAQAGTDTTFGGVATTVTAWMTGSLGVIVSLFAVAAGTLMTVIRASAIPVISGVGVALAMATAPAVIGAIVTATLDPALPAAVALPASI